MTAKHRRHLGVFAPKQLFADNRYAVDQLDNSRLDILPRYRRDGAPDDPWLSPSRSEAVRALLILINAAARLVDPSLGQAEEPDLEAICRDAGLTDCQTEAVLMAGEGWSVVMIARFLEISHQAVSLRLHNGRRKLLRQVPPLDVMKMIQTAT